MNVLSANFYELYRRHLCRHSQFGINVIHLLAVVGTYLAIYGLVYAVVQLVGAFLAARGIDYEPAAGRWVLVALTVPYLAILAFNVPLRVFVVNVLFIGLFFAVFFALPELPWWAYLVAVPVIYKIQAWSHKVYSKEMDMTEWNQKYPKGFALFILLSVYELPILLNYLCFGKKDWTT
jgi:hypothetical protein